MFELDSNLGNNDNRKDNKSIMCCFAPYSYNQLPILAFVYMMIRQLDCAFDMTFMLNDNDFYYTIASR